MLKRVFIEKKPEFATAAENLANSLKLGLNISNLEKVRIINRYDCQVESREEFSLVVNQVLSEKNVDNIYYDELPDCANLIAFGKEFLPGQYDQRADSAMQCIKLLTMNENCKIKNAIIYVLYGNLDSSDINKIKNYLINPVDSRETSLDSPLEFKENNQQIEKTPIIENFINKSEDELKALLKEMGLAMDIFDLLLIKEYFKNDEKRNPTLTELKVLDTYWSDHCRHTTFSTILKNISFEEGKVSNEIKESFEKYLSLRKELYVGKEKDLTLMDMAVIGTKAIKKQGYLTDLEESDEINACSFKAKVDVDGKDEDYLIMFKNETHNHPTEIEPFGGAATCLGGAIRDPLSGRSYVYQSMRVTGSGDPTLPYEETLKGKLPQRKITTEAANGFSSYGNQIGLCTGQVKEYYHSNYQAKRMEIGAVIAAGKEENVKRIKPVKGDVIILVGGRTGRDGIGGASGSSKEHTVKSVETAGSEVQKGNAPEERKLQRLFRNEEVSKMIKKCNDFGAGGVSVAVGELADSLEINLDNVLKKYDGLNATEIAISESQERMAVVLDPKDEKKFMDFVVKENLEATKVAVVTNSGRIEMSFNGERILSLKRSFIDTNGAKKNANILVENYPVYKNHKYDNAISLKENFKKIYNDKNTVSQKGLVEMFDNTIGSTNVVMPYGGKCQLSEADGMVSKIPLLKGNTKTVTIMTHGFDPYVSNVNPYQGAINAVVSSLTKIVSLGSTYKNTKLSFQEYFPRLRDDEKRWALPFSALLGGLKVQEEMKVAAIGGKDSMSGSFHDLDVVPTLVSFAVNVGKVEDIVTQEFKEKNSKVYLLKARVNENNIFDFNSLKENYEFYNSLVKNKKIISAKAIGMGGILEAISKMSFGNKIGFEFDDKLNLEIEANCSDIVFETSDELDNESLIYLGKTNKEAFIKKGGEEILIDELIDLYINPLNDVFPIKAKKIVDVKEISYTKGVKSFPSIKSAKPKVTIPVFPGTNCEYDTMKAFNEAGGEGEIFVFNNTTTTGIEDSVKELEKLIRNSQILALPGGFSAGDEPDGSGKFIVSVLKNERIKDAVMDLLKNRDGLILGICNGFQALVKTGLVTYGEIRELDETSPTLTYNTISRHIATFAYTKVTSNLSPWLNEAKMNQAYATPLSHGEGRFVCNDEILKKLIENGQIATQYCDYEGNLSTDTSINLNGSSLSIEGITSPCGRVLGKMGHCERKGEGLYKNIYGNVDIGLFNSGVKYFK